MIIPADKSKVIANAYSSIAVVEKQYRSGAITDGERYNKIVDVWTQANEEISNVMMRTLEHNHGRAEFNPVFIMADSGARGNKNQVRQLAGMRGLMAKPSGEIIERPIVSNFREGLTVLEYFISTHGARKGLADTALKTADSGYMTRKLHDVAQDVIINEEDCGTVNGIWVKSIMEGEDEIVKLTERIVGRVSCEDIKDPVTRKADRRSRRRHRRNQGGDDRSHRHGAGEDPLGAHLRNAPRRLLEVLRHFAGLQRRWPSSARRSASSPRSPSANPARSSPCVPSTSAAPPRRSSSSRQIKAKNDGTVQYTDLRTVKSLDNNHIVLNKNGSISIHAEDGRELERYTVVIGSVISVADGGKVKKGETFVQWDPYNVSILTEKAGKVEFRDIIEGVTMKREMDEATKQVGTVIIEHKEDLHPQIVIIDEDKEVIASLLAFPPARTSK